MRKTIVRTTSATNFFLGVGMLIVVVAGGCGGVSTNNNRRGSRDPGAAAVSGTIVVGTAPSAIAVDSVSNKIYVTDFGTQPTPSSYFGCSPTGADVTVIDGATQSATAVPLAGMVNPLAMALNPASHRVYLVAKEWGPQLLIGKGCEWIFDDVTAIDTSTLSATAIYKGMTVGRLGFLGIDVNQASGDIYLSDAATLIPHVNSSVIIIGSNGATIPVGTDASGIAVNAPTNKIYVANTGTNDISVIDGATNSVVATGTDPNALAPTAVAVNPTNNAIYIANSQSNNLTIIDGASDTVTTTIPVGTSPSSVAVNPQTNFIYVANTGNPQTGDSGNVTVIDGSTLATTTLKDAKAKNPIAVAVNCVTNKIYVANSGSNNVTVIDGAHD